MIFRRRGELSLLRSLSTRGAAPTEAEAELLPVIWEESAEATQQRLNLSERLNTIKDVETVGIRGEPSLQKVDVQMDLHVIPIEDLELKFQTNRTTGLSSTQV